VKLAASGDHGALRRGQIVPTHLAARAAAAPSGQADVDRIGAGVERRLDSLHASGGGQKERREYYVLSTIHGVEQL